MPFVTPDAGPRGEVATFGSLCETSLCCGSCPHDLVYKLTPSLSLCDSAQRLHHCTEFMFYKQWYLRIGSSLSLSLSLCSCFFPSTGDGTCLLTGPSTSPENSLPAVKNLLMNGLPPPTADEEGELAPKLRRSRPSPRKLPPTVIFPFVAMSPAIGEHDYSCCRPL